MIRSRFFDIIIPEKTITRFTMYKVLLEFNSCLALPFKHKLFLTDEFTHFYKSIIIFFLFWLINTRLFYYQILFQLKLYTLLSFCTLFTQILQCVWRIYAWPCIYFHNRKKPLRFKSSRFRLFLSKIRLVRITALYFYWRVLFNVFKQSSFTDWRSLLGLSPVRRVQISFRWLLS